MPRTITDSLGIESPALVCCLYPTLGCKMGWLFSIWKAVCYVRSEWRVSVDRRVIKTIDGLLKDVRVCRVICCLLWETYVHSSSHTLRHSFYHSVYSFWHESLFSLMPCFLRWLLLLPPEGVGCLYTWIFWFSGAFQKTTVSFFISIHFSVRPSAWNNSAPTGRILIKFYVWVFF